MQSEDFDNIENILELAIEKGEKEKFLLIQEARKEAATFIRNTLPEVLTLLFAGFAEKTELAPCAPNVSRYYAQLVVSSILDLLPHNEKYFAVESEIETLPVRSNFLGLVKIPAIKFVKK
jgi:hypothetical protein